MDIKHTQEPWKFLEQGDADEYCLVTADGLKWVIAFRINGEMMPDMQRANARRIVACVNACAGIPTSLLENIGKGMGPNWLQAKQQRDTAWEELRKIREAIKANPEESTFDEVERVVSQGDILLEALKGLIEFAEPYFDKDGFGYIGKLEAAKKCIAKAEGRL